MNIKNKFKLWQTAFAYESAIVIHKVCICQNGIISYLWYSPKSNDADWYEEWQITDNVRKIWFNDSE